MNARPWLYIDQRAHLVLEDGTRVDGRSGGMGWMDVGGVRIVDRTIQRLSDRRIVHFRSVDGGPWSALPETHPMAVEAARFNESYADPVGEHTKGGAT